MGLLDIPATLNYNHKNEEINYIDYVSQEIENNLYQEDTGISYKGGDKKNYEYSE